MTAYYDVGQLDLHVDLDVCVCVCVFMCVHVLAGFIRSTVVGTI